MAEAGRLEAGRREGQLEHRGGTRRAGRLRTSPTARCYLLGATHSLSLLIWVLSQDEVSLLCAHLGGLESTEGRDAAQFYWTALGWVPRVQSAWLYHCDEPAGKGEGAGIPGFGRCFC